MFFPAVIHSGTDMNESFHDCLMFHGFCHKYVCVTIPEALKNIIICTLPSVN